MRELYRIETDFSCFGLDIEDGKVIEAAPIAKWCIGRTKDFIISYWKNRGARIECINNTMGV